MPKPLTHKKHCLFLGVVTWFCLGVVLAAPPVNLSPLPDPVKPPASALTQEAHTEETPETKANTPYPELAAMEAKWLGVVQPSLEPKQRLANLEKFVFGQANPDKLQTAEARYKALLNVYDPPTEPLSPLPEEMREASKPAEETADDTSKAIKQPAPKKDLITTLEQLEEQLLGAPYPKLSLGERTDQLEELVLGQPQTGPLAKRIEALDKRVHGASTTADVTSEPVVTSETAMPPSLFPEEEAAGSPDSTPMQPILQGVGPVEMQRLAILEAKVFKEKKRKKNNTSVANQASGSLPVDERLAKLEQAVFSKESPPGLTAKARIERLETVVDASPKQTINDVKINQAVQMALPFALGVLLLLL